MSALGAEVIWTRLLSLMLGATVYTFSIILAVFLVGLGIGSSAGSILSRDTTRPRALLGVCQLLLAAAIAWTAYVLGRSLPYWPIDPSLAVNPWLNFQLDLMRCAWAILPATCLWGASFPLALASVASRTKEPGRLVGGIYAANTLGAIAGALLFSMVVIPWLGTQQAQRLLIGLASLSALLMMATACSSSSTSVLRPSSPWPRLTAGVALLIAIALAALLARSVPVIPWGIVAYGRQLPTRNDPARLLYLGEGMNSSVAVTELNSGVRNFHVSGKIEASSESQDMRLQRMLGHLSALLHPKPRSVLVVGCGAGVTAGSFVVHPDVEKIVICEIEPLIPQVVARYFGTVNHNVLSDRRVQVVYDDARHFILTTRQKFDVITSDPIHPWVKGSAMLYSKEYFEICRQHLNPGGVITQWVPLYESNPEVVKSELATFFDVFPNGTIWSNDIDGVGYDVVLAARPDGSAIDVDAMQQRLDQRDYLPVAASLGDVGFGSAVSLLGTYAGQASDLAPWLAGAQINRDRNLRLQYLAGLGLNAHQAEGIYRAMRAYRKYSQELFVASDSTTRALRKAMGPPQ